jgi:hypothetical protein
MGALGGASNAKVGRESKHKHGSDNRAPRTSRISSSEARREAVRLAIIVGHSEDSPGARATFPIDMYEYHFHDKLAIDIYREARENGLDAQVFKRDGISRRKLGELVDAFTGPEGMAVELHFNSFDGQVKGTETLFDKEPVYNEAFARIMHRHVVRAFERTGKRDRGIKEVEYGTRGWVNLDSVHCVSCLLEPVFGDNQDEALLLYKNKSEYVRAIVAACVEWTIEREKHV